jgi:hypothetical protein
MFVYLPTYLPTYAFVPPSIHLFINPLIYLETKFRAVIAQAVIRWLPTATARVRSRVWWSGICHGQSGAGAGFLRVLRFPPSIFFPPIAPQSPSPFIWGWYNRPEVAAVHGTLFRPTSNKRNRMGESPIRHFLSRPKTNTHPAGRPHIDIFCVLRLCMADGLIDTHQLSTCIKTLRLLLLANFFSNSNR